MDHPRAGETRGMSNSRRLRILLTEVAMCPWWERRLSYDADVIVVGAGLAGLGAAAEIADARKRVIVVDQEPEQSLGGQAFWSLGGFFLVDTPPQRRLGAENSYED